MVMKHPVVGILPASDSMVCGIYGILAVMIQRIYLIQKPLVARLMFDSSMSPYQQHIYTIFRPVAESRLKL